MSLNDKHQRFVHEYLIDLNGAQAAIRAGYSEARSRQTASELLARDDVSEALAAQRLKLAERTGIAAERVLNELGLLAFSNALDYLRVGDDGQPYTDFSGLTRAQAAALTEVTVETRTEYGETPDYEKDGKRKGTPVRKVRFKLADKRGPLVDLGKHLGLFKGDGEDPGKPAHPAQLSTIEAARRVGFLLAKAVHESKGKD